jgi:hypothetical protein
LADNECGLNRSRAGFDVLSPAIESYNLHLSRDANRTAADLIAAWRVRTTSPLHRESELGLKADVVVDGIP